jgi:hypothetical protein
MSTTRGSRHTSEIRAAVSASSVTDTKPNPACPDGYSRVRRRSGRRLRSPSPSMMRAVSAFAAPGSNRASRAFDPHAKLLSDDLGLRRHSW